MINDCGAVKLTFTAPGDDFDSTEPAKEYIIKYSEYASVLTEVCKKNQKTWEKLLKKLAWNHKS